MNIQLDHPSNPPLARLLRKHRQSMTAHSPPESIHALDPHASQHADLTFWSAWTNDELLGCAALKQLDARHGEIKSMRTVDAHRREGVAARLLQHLLDEAAWRGYERLSLETGSAAAFEPAHRLYARFGFAFCGPFGDYVEDPYSVYMTRVLASPGTAGPA